VPLSFIPGLGPAKMNRLLAEYGTEMNILHQTSREQLTDIVGAEIALLIVQARSGELQLSSGGGGTYGKVMAKSENRI